MSFYPVNQVMGSPKFSICGSIVKGFPYWTLVDTMDTAMKGRGFENSRPQGSVDPTWVQS